MIWGEGCWGRVSDDEDAQRVRDVQAAIEGEQRSLVTGGSVSSIRTSSGPGLAMLPFLTINDIIALRENDFHELEDIEQRLLEVPEPAWEHVLDLVRARVIRVEAQDL